MLKRLYLLFAFLLFGLLANAQDFEIVSVEHLPNDFAAREEMKTDHSDRQCALLRIATQKITPEQREGFTFKSDLGSELVERATRNGEIWLWVSPGLKYLRVMHRDWGQYELKLFDHVSRVESLHTYKIVVKGLEFGPGPDPKDNTPRQQYLAFQITPVNATLEVDNQIWEVDAEGSANKFVPFGTYSYRVRAKDYHAEEGSVTVDNPNDMHKVTVTLRPNFGWIEVAGTGNLSGASVYIDSDYVGKAPCRSERLKSGQHCVSIAKEMYDTYSETVTVDDNKTTNLSPILKANFAEVTLKVEADAEIWVNNEKKGTRSWTGLLGSGTYKIECKQSNHETSVTTKEITAAMTGQTIVLPSPTPIYGSLNVESTPKFCKLFIDGQAVGETPKFISEILIGQHSLLLEKEGCAPLTKTFTIEKGKTKTFNETLDTGRSIVVKTDRSGDKIYVDGEYVGETPRVTSLGFGEHTIVVERSGIKVSQKVDIKEGTRNGLEMTFEFGRLVTIHTDQPGDVVYIDGVEVGKSPVSIDLPVGKHSIHAQRDKKFADKEIKVMKEGGVTEHFLILHGETVSHFLQNGVNFVTLDGAYSMAPQLSFGATFGSVNRIGWFVTAASNFSFAAMKSSATAGSDGLVDGEYYYDYTGESCSSRLSAMAGMVVRVGGPVFIKFGAGYGSRVKSWYITDGTLVKISDDSCIGVDATAGLLFNLKGFSLSLDAVTTNFKTVEAKVGLGYCWKRK